MPGGRNRLAAKVVTADLKRAESALRESEARFRATFENAAIGLAHVALDGRWLRVNRRFCEITGYTRDQLLSRTFAEVTHPDDIEADWKLKRALISGEIPTCSFEKRYLRKDGTAIWVNLTVSLLRDRSGAPTEFISVVEDISERKAAEKSLHESEDRYRGFVAASSDVVYRMSADWKEMRFLQGRDFIPDTLDPSGTWLEKYIHPDDQAHVMAAIHEAIRTKTTFQLEHRVRRVDGTLGWTFSRAIPLLDSNGEISEWFGAASDVTKRKEAEEALRESERRFRELADNMSQFAWVADSTGWIFWYNRRWYEFTGGTLDEMQGWGWQKVHHPDHLDRVVTGIRAALDAGDRWEDTFPLRGKNGGYRWFLSRALPIRDANDNVVRWFGTNTDITEQREAEIALRTSEEHVRELNISLEQRVEERTRALAEANRELEAFGYSVSHDLRAPLRTLQGFSQALLEDYAPDLPAKAQKYLERIAFAANRLDELIQDLLAYSRLSRAELRLEPVSLAQVVEDVCRQLDLTIQEARAKVNVERLPTVRGHSGTLVQIFANLLSNSIKFVQPGEEPQIRVWAEGNGSTIRVWVADNGIGIELEHQDRIFEVFERLHGLEAYPGTGIGLAIVRRGAQRLGGCAGVESRYGSGSRFWVELQSSETTTEGDEQRASSAVGGR
jgi:PAS domain S-box-containing protein